MKLQIKLLDVSEGDIYYLNILRNDRDVMRSANVNAAKIESLVSTKKWITTKSEAGEFYVIRNRDLCVGYLKAEEIRFGDFSKKFLEIGIAINSEYQGLGIGSRALKLFCKQRNNENLLARVALSNLASSNIFKRNGFNRIGVLKGILHNSKYKKDSDVEYLVKWRN